VPHECIVGSLHLLASQVHVKDKHGEARALFCRELVEAQKAREQDRTRSKTMEVEP
jgi:hypothetical protein